MLYAIKVGSPQNPEMLKRPNINEHGCTQLAYQKILHFLLSIDMFWLIEFKKSCHRHLMTLTDTPDAFSHGSQFQFDRNIWDALFHQIGPAVFVFSDSKNFLADSERGRSEESFKLIKNLASTIIKHIISHQIRVPPESRNAKTSEHQLTWFHTVSLSKIMHFMLSIDIF